MSRNLRTAMLALLGICCMGGLGFASVPLYRIFCEATGLNGTTQRGGAAPGATGQRVTVRFDANTAPRMPWRFTPDQNTENVRLGEQTMAFFTATNRSSQPVTGTATFNVAPAQAGAYFNKIQCFCFTEQTLQPGETVRMPVIYFVDPKLASDPDTADVEDITLSYTFYPVDSAKKGS